jgi:hypothetical protein
MSTPILGVIYLIQPALRFCEFARMLCRNVEPAALCRSNEYGGEAPIALTKKDKELEMKSSRLVRVLSIATVLATASSMAMAAQSNEPVTQPGIAAQSQKDALKSSRDNAASPASNREPTKDAASSNASASTNGRGDKARTESSKDPEAATRNNGQGRY